MNHDIPRFYFPTQFSLGPFSLVPKVLSGFHSRSMHVLYLYVCEVRNPAVP